MMLPFVAKKRKGLLNRKMSFLEKSLRFLFGSAPGFVVLFAGLGATCYAGGKVLEQYHSLAREVPVIQQQFWGNGVGDTCILQEGFVTVHALMGRAWATLSRGSMRWKNRYEKEEAIKTIG